jgi:SnoaL-like domain
MPSQELHSREALATVFADLNKYDATTHFVGQSTIFTFTGDRATGEAYCLAHHVTVDGGMVMSQSAQILIDQGEQGSKRFLVAGLPLRQ